MDINFNSMNHVYHKTSSGALKIGPKSNAADAQSMSPVSEQKTDKSDKVLISSAATQQYEIYKMTKAVMKEIDSIDMSKEVEAIKSQIENNTYQISPDKIANAVLSRWAM